MPMMNKPKTRASNTRFSPTCFLKRFAQDEDGSVLVMTIVLLVTMLIMGGMAVDFMRFESRRAEIQGVSDRAVLAAASLNQTLPAGDVVIDHFEKAGYANSIVGAPEITEKGSSKSVRVNAEVDVQTFFLRLAGIDVLSAPAASRAIEGSGEIEISLVLDISGSMRQNVSFHDDDGNWVTKTKMELLREAASNFATEVLGTNMDPDDPTEELDDPIVSMSLVTYASHVNVGNDIFNALNVAVNRSADPNHASNGRFENPSRCVDFNTSEFSTTEFNTTRMYRQVEHIEFWGENAPPVNTICPRNSYESIIPLAHKPGQLTPAIAQLQPRTNTSIHMGMKWGVSLLDPSTQAILENVSGVHDNFAGVRPYEYPTAESGLNTVKYVILMTDGENVAQERLLESAYDSYEEHTRYETSSFYYWWKNALNWEEQQKYLEYVEPVTERRCNQYGCWNQTVQDGYWKWALDQIITEEAYTATEADTWLQQICTEAKKQDIIVYTIAMGATTGGQAQMEACASEPTDRFYHETEGDAIKAIFKEIADQITDLRLNL